MSDADRNTLGTTYISNWASWTVYPDDQVLLAVKKIAQDGGAGDHGSSTVKSTTCLHWRAGDWRIFGTVSGTQMDLVAFGMHKGKDNNTYSVTLPSGKSATATNNK